MRCNCSMEIPSTTSRDRPESLLASRMRLALAGKNRVWPLVFFLRQRHGRRDGLELSPIGGRRLDAPDVSGLLESDAHQPDVSSGSQGNTIGDASGCACPAWKFIEQNGQTWIERPAESHAATFGIHHQSVTLFAEQHRRVLTC